MSAAAIKGPFALAASPDASPFGTDGEYIDLNAANHGGIAMLVWRAEDDLSSPHLEAFAHHVVAALNAHDELVASLELLVALNFDSDQTTRTAIRRARAVLSTLNMPAERPQHTASPLDVLKDPSMLALAASIGAGFDDQSLEQGEPA
ncbi:MAG: hypothetical protein V4614_15080 [Pseudomonadota bacterium]